MKQKHYLFVMVIAAFSSFICGCTIDSVWADNHHANSYLLGTTVILAALSIASLAMASLKIKQ
jgi:hypothetical protein